MSTISSTIPKFVGDDWMFPFNFIDSTGTPIDMSASTFSADLIIEDPYTVYSVSGGNGSIDVTAAATGMIVVTVSNTLTTTLTPDVDSVFVQTDGRVTFPTRLAFIAASPTINTDAIVPIKVIRR